MAAVTNCSDFGAPKIKSDTVSTVSPSIFHEVTGPDTMILVFWMLSFRPTFSLSSITFIKRLFSSSLLSAIKVVSSAYLRLMLFLLAILIPACATSSPTSPQFKKYGYIAVIIFGSKSVLIIFQNHSSKILPYLFTESLSLLICVLFISRRYIPFTWWFPVYFCILLTLVNLILTAVRLLFPSIGMILVLDFLLRVE